MCPVAVSRQYQASTSKLQTTDRPVPRGRRANRRDGFLEAREGLVDAVVGDGIVRAVPSGSLRLHRCVPHRSPPVESAAASSSSAKRTASSSVMSLNMRSRRRFSSSASSSRSAIFPRCQQQHPGVAPKKSWPWNGQWFVHRVRHVGRKYFFAQPLVRAGLCRGIRIETHRVWWLGIDVGLRFVPTAHLLWNHRTRSPPFVRHRCLSSRWSSAAWGSASPPKSLRKMFALWRVPGRRGLRTRFPRPGGANPSLSDGRGGGRGLRRAFGTVCVVAPVPSCAGGRVTAVAWLSSTPGPRTRPGVLARGGSVFRVTRLPSATRSATAWERASPARSRCASRAPSSVSTKPCNLRSVRYSSGVDVRERESRGSPVPPPRRGVRGHR